ncbi:hypothetical protein [Vibrio lentus]|uniref:hypothetical protein n=1 Tax=Vibrio lentus TaxID=136468 RepID=UPI000C84BD7A|nr:hypothetical protein [Vibrio lentus]PML25115.1 hypothetical protein BCT80_20335 [Vibrio lentus]
MTKQLSPTKEKPWYCFDGDQKEYFATEGLALTAANEAIQYYLDEFWDEQVTSVQVGKVTHITKQIEVRKRPDDSEIDEEGCDRNSEYWGDCDYKCNYVPAPISQAQEGVNHVSSK